MRKTTMKNNKNRKSKIIDKRDKKQNKKTTQDRALGQGEQ